MFHYERLDKNTSDEITTNKGNPHFPWIWYENEGWVVDYDNPANKPLIQGGDNA